MSDRQLEKKTEAIVAVVDQIEAVPGVISIHGQLADALAVLVVLVESDEARDAVRQLECQIFDTTDLMPIDIRVRRVQKAELAAQQEALDTAYGRLGFRN